MKLAEALTERHDAQVRLSQLSGRIAENAVIQEGDDPSEDVQALLRDAEETVARISELVAQINATNSATVLSSGYTLTMALAKRDGEQSLQRLFSSAASAGSRGGAARYLRTELRMVSTLDVADLRKKADAAAKRYRELDTLIQQANWTTDLIE